MTTLAVLIAAGSLGAMLFFSAVIAPMTFGVLGSEAAGKFLRALFPWYFLINGVAAGVAGLLAWHGVVTPLFVVAALAMLAVRFGMIPVINAARDAMLAGEAGAKARFDAWHRGSVIVNTVEMAALVAGIVVLVR